MYFNATYSHEYACLNGPCFDSANLRASVMPCFTEYVTLTDPRVNLRSGSYSLFTDGGTSLVIHAKADDMKTDPSGNSGDRIACGVITK